MTGTKRNTGLDKMIYRHNISREEAQQIPHIIRNEPVETNARGQNVYYTKGPNGDIRTVTSSIEDENNVATMYKPGLDK